MAFCWAILYPWQCIVESIGLSSFVDCVLPGDSRGYKLVFSGAKFGADSEYQLEIVLHFVV